MQSELQRASLLPTTETYEVHFPHFVLSTHLALSTSANFSASLRVVLTSIGFNTVSL